MAWNTDLDTDSLAYKIAAEGNSRIRVIAGPGTGKSYAMKRRTARLLEEGGDPKRVLAVTFTRVAAEDLHRELQKLGVPGCESLEGKTLHSVAMTILAQQHVLQALGRNPRPLSGFEQKAMYCDIAPAHGGKTKCGELVEAYESAWAQSQGDQPGFPKTPEEKAFQADLLSWHGFHQSMLIGEVIPYLVRYLKENPAAAEHGAYDHVLADEFQDLNKAEQTAIAYLSENANICIVGDDDQSIYGFKYAHPEGIREWTKLYPDSADFQMAECQRCPTDIVEMANSLIGHNKQRDDRKLIPLTNKGKGEVEIVQVLNSEVEAKWIATKVDSLLKSGVEPHEIIVLVQRKKGAPAVVGALREAGVPAKSYYEESQLDSEDAQMHFAVFKLFLNKDDRVALRYLVGLSSHNFYAGAYARLRSHCEQTGDTPFEALDRLSAGTLTLPHTKPMVQQFEKIKDVLADLEPFRSKVPELIDELFPSSEASIQDLRDLALAVMGEASDASELFSLMMREITQPDIPPEVKEVRVMSLNKSKGLSSPYVFIAQCVQGVVPKIQKAGTPQAVADAQLEEARRLFFVGITRVKSGNGRPGSLYLTYPREMGANTAKGLGIPFTKTIYGKAQLSPSMFIHELGPAAPAPIVGNL